MSTCSNEKNCAESALEKASKLVCNLKCGICPVREEDFTGCPYECTQEVKPWQCWVAYFKNSTF
jgi:hypothetical protein